ncbi:MAG: 2-dehydro-3-deoxygalactonokinase [Hyphomicrobiaceae bacterium]
MTTPRLIAVDWGTTTLRCYLTGANGSILNHIESSDGILSVSNGAFADVLASAVKNLGISDRELPIVLSGMIGSRQGWVEAPYVPCPASLQTIADRLVRIEADPSQVITLIPGLETQSSDGVPDVIRGEETQIFGAMAGLGTNDAEFVLPGTHSKWVSVRNGDIIAFRTFMTGEVFAALRSHTILGRMASGPEDDSYFETGVEASSAAGPPGDLLHQVFSARTLALFDKLPGSGVATYLSGLLIGFEIRAAAAANQPIHVMAGSTLGELYVRAANVIGLATTLVDGASIVRGHLAIADAAGI